MRYPVRIVTWQSEWIVLTASVARWLWPKSAKECHKKLLDSAESLVTNFQLKSAISSEVLLKNRSFLTWETYKVKQYTNFSPWIRFLQACWTENAGLGQHTPFGPQFSISLYFDFLSKITAACLIFCMTNSSCRSFSNGCLFLHSRKMLSNKQSEHSFSPTTFCVCLCNLKLCGTLGSMQKVL